jgi:hypothetical protein
MFPFPETRLTCSECSLLDSAQGGEDLIENLLIILDHA